LYPRSCKVVTSFAPGRGDIAVKHNRVAREMSGLFLSYLDQVADVIAIVIKSVPLETKALPSGSGQSMYQDDKSAGRPTQLK
jgi:hypothetical protein